MYRILIAFLVILLLSACSSSLQGEDLTPENEIDFQPTPTLITPEEGLGGIIGTIQNLDDYWTDREVTIYAAEFHGDVEGDGFYLLEPYIFPKSIVLDGGIFQIDNMKPGNYVLVVGPTPYVALVIRDGTRPVIYEVLAGDILDVGMISITP